jgi:hypothetical protein
MKNIYEKIEKIFQQDATLPPQWALELMNEIREVKQLLQNREKPRASNNLNFYAFVNKFRESMKADAEKSIFPEIQYNHQAIGVDSKGHLYYKENAKTLQTNEAFRVYRFLYENKDKVLKYSNN